MRMKGISYEEPSSNSTGLWLVQVRLDGKLTGQIRKVSGGYQYWPKGVKKHAEQAYFTLAEVKKSLENRSERMQEREYIKKSMRHLSELQMEYKISNN